MSHVFILDVVDSLLVGGKFRGAEVLLSRLDLMTFIPYGYKFDEKIDQIHFCKVNAAEELSSKFNFARSK